MAGERHNTVSLFIITLYSLLLPGDPATGSLYSASMDGEIKLWSVEDPSRPRCLATAIQTVITRHVTCDT